MSVGEVLRRKHEPARCRRSSPSSAHDKVRDAVALLHEHRVSQLPVVSAHDPTRSSAASASAGCCATPSRRSLLNADVVDVMEPPFPAVAADDAASEAVELLAGERGALLVTVDGRAAGIVTRADLLEALAR